MGRSRNVQPEVRADHDRFSIYVSASCEDAEKALTQGEESPSNKMDRILLCVEQHATLYVRVQKKHFDYNIINFSLTPPLLMFFFGRQQV